MKLAIFLISRTNEDLSKLMSDSESKPKIEVMLRYTFFQIWLTSAITQLLRKKKSLVQRRGCMISPKLQMS